MTASRGHAGGLWSVRPLNDNDPPEVFHFLDYSDCNRRPRARAATFTETDPS